MYGLVVGGFALESAVKFHICAGAQVQCACNECSSSFNGRTVFVYETLERHSQAIAVCHSIFRP